MKNKNLGKNQEITCKEGSDSNDCKVLIKTMEDRRPYQPGVLYPTETSLKNESNMKTGIENTELR